MIFNTAQINKTAASPNASAENSEQDSSAGDFIALLNSPNLSTKNFVCADREIVSEKDSDEAPAKENNLPPVSEFMPVDCFPRQLPAPNIQQNFSEDCSEFSPGDKTDFAGSPISAPEQSFLPPTDKTLSEKFQEFIKTNLENGKVEILDSPTGEKIFTPQKNFFSTEKLESVNVLPKFFGEISNLLKSENAPKPKSTDAMFDAAFKTENSGKNSLVEQVKANFSETSEFNFNQPQAAKPKDGKPLESATDFSAIGFNKVLDSVAKEQKIAQTALPVKPHEVLEQVETQMAQLINLDKSEIDKKVLKMRLHPAELGAVEVRLEKNSDGKLHAHFQTENAAAQQILSENLEHLRDSLQNSGWQIERLEISNNSSASPENGGRGNDRSQPFENRENYQSSTSDNSAISVDDSADLSANRLLSVRA